MKIDISKLEPGDKLKYHYGKGNKNNCTVEFRGLIDGHFAVLREWKGFKGFYYFGVTNLRIHINVFKDHLTLIKKSNTE
jgi:hypothetical protein